jgi:hypothetical protein
MLQTILVLVVVPLGLYLLIALVAAGRRRTKPARYRPGDPWDYAPVWWSANPEGARSRTAAAHATAAQAGARGGADGGW